MANHPNRKRAIKKKITSPSAPVHDHDRDYNALLQSMGNAFAVHKGPLFQTATPDMNALYLDSLPSERQIHDCSTCRHFLQRFGSLVTINDDGTTRPALWEPQTVPEFYLRSVGTMANATARAQVTGPFLSGDVMWGTLKTGAWTHMAVPSPRVYRHALLTANQAMAKTREDFGNVARALAEFTAPTIATALRALDSGWLASEQKFIGPLKWLADLHTKRTAAKNKNIRDNLLWLAVTNAPAGYCHPRSSVIGTLLEDIAAGLPFNDVRARFNAKVNPLQYQRPQVAPSAGNIAEGEKIIAKLGLERSLVRRFARLDECVTIWKPLPPAAPQRGAYGVFAHIAPKGSTDLHRPDLAIPPQTMTWQKFVRTALYGSERVEVEINRPVMNFVAFTTAEHADAPPILKWDAPHDRNPVAWYTYPGGSPPSRWNMAAGWAKVTGIASAPPLWGDDPKPYLGDGALMILAGCVDQMTGQGNALFPQCLINDLHGVRSTIEAYSRSAELLGREQASACGLYVGTKNTIGYDLRVTVGGVMTRYRIDRWD